MFRSLLSYIFVREFLVQDVLYLHTLRTALAAIPLVSDRCGVDVQ